MIKRFQIEELVQQDGGGVIFAALDTETQRPVAVRRFFPFGAEGGGLEADEQTAYAIAVKRLAGVRHPGLRPIIAGGCDPVDGMPYLAAEAVEGVVLDKLIARQPLAPADAVALLTRALEVSAVLSEVLAEEAVWVETDLRTIVANGEQEFTFWICPVKWLGGEAADRGLGSVVALAEAVMHWQGQIVSAQAGRGLGGWVKWLRAAAPTTSIREAMETLAAATGAEPPPPVAALIREATGSKPLKVKPHSLKPQMVAILALALAVAGLGLWALEQRATGQEVAAAKVEGQAASDPVPAARRASATPVSTRTEDAVARANRRAAEISAQMAAADSASAARRAEMRSAGNVFSPEDRDLLLQETGNEVAVRAVVSRIDRSSTGKTTYVFLVQKAGAPEIAGGIAADKAGPGLKKEELAAVVGKTVVVRGRLRSEFGKRLLVMIENRASIEVVD